MIKCPNCSTDNKDHYKFCLVCGSELPRDAAAQARSFTTPTPPSGVPMVQIPNESPAIQQPEVQTPKPSESAYTVPEANVPQDVNPQLSPTPTNLQSPISGEPKVTPQASKDNIKICPSCGATVPINFRFCGICGTTMDTVTPIKKEVAEEKPAVAKQQAPAKMVLIRPDGTEGESIDLFSGETKLGRTTHPLFSQDLFLSPLHTTIYLSEEKGINIRIKDENSLNGIFLRVQPKQPLEIYPSDIIRLGQELIKFEIIGPPKINEDGTEYMGSPINGFWGKITLIIGKDIIGNSFLIGDDGIVLGRERGDIIFPEDGYVSGVHLRIYKEGENCFITDLGSSNGTFIKLRDEQILNNGDFVLMGQQLFRVTFN